MIRPLLAILLILGSCYMHAQIEDVTPPGIWKDFDLQTSYNVDYYVVSATDTNDQKMFYQLRQPLEPGGFDAEIVSLNPDMIFTSVDYLGSEGDDVGDLDYFIGIDDNDRSHFIAAGISIPDIIEIPNQGNWRRGNIAVQMSNGSLYCSLKDYDTNLYYPASITRDSITILDTIGLEYLNDFYGDNQSRVYCRYDDSLGGHYLAYYDIEQGFVKTTIPAAYYSMVSGNPGDSIHSIVSHSVNPGEGKIYRVIGASFNEINVPGGPYNDISVLWRSDETNTTLFRLRNDNDYKLVKRTNGKWEDLTPQLIGIDVEGISTLASFQHEIFLNIEGSLRRRFLYNFQSYDTGDTLLNLSPVDYIINYISAPIEKINYPLTIVMKGDGGDSLYSFYYGIAPLISPPSVLENPNDEPSVGIYSLGHNVYEFGYYNNDSSDTYYQLYHRIAPGLAFTPLSLKDSVEFFEVCSLEDEVIYKEIYFNGSSRFYQFDFDSVSNFTILNEVSSRHIDLVATEEVCLLQEFNNASKDSTTRIFATNDGPEVIVNITHPRYTLEDIGSSYNYEGLIISAFQNRNQEGDARLWLINTKNRRGSNCIYKFFNDPIIPVLDTDNAAKQHYIGGVIPQYFAEGSDMYFNAEESIELTPGAEITQGMIVEMNIEDCDR